MAVGIRKVVRSIGVGLYLLVTRTAMTAAVVFTALFFILNSSPFPDRLANALVGVIPGTFEFGRIQASPIPWIIDVTDVAIKTPSGKPIIEAGTVRVRVRLLPLVRFLLNPDSRELHLEFASVRLDDFKVLLQFDKNYHLELVDAFSDPHRVSHNKKPFNVILGFDRITGTDGHAFLEFPEWDLEVDGIDMKTTLDITTHPVHVLVKAEYFNYMSGTAHVKADPDNGRIPRKIRMNQGFIDRFVYNWDEIGFEKLRAAFDFGSINATGGFLSWAQNLKYAVNADIELPDGSHAVTKSGGGLVSGPMLIHLSGSGDRANPDFSLQMESPALKLDDFDLGRVEFGATGNRDETGDYVFSNINLSSTAGDSSFSVFDGFFIPAPSREGTLWEGGFLSVFRNFDAGRLARRLKIGSEGRFWPFPGSIDGHVRFSASLSGQSVPGPVIPETILKVGVDGRLEGQLERRGILDGKSFVLDASAELSARDVRKPAVRLSNVRLSSGNDLLSVAGTVDFSRERLFLEGSASKDVRSLAAAFGVSVREGTVGLSSVRLDGPFSSVSGTGGITVSDLAWGKWQVGQAAADAVLVAGDLNLSNIRAVTPFAKFAVESASVPLFGPGGKAPRNRKVELSDVSASGLDVEKVPELKDSGLSGSGQARARGFAIDLARPLRTAASRFAVDLDWARAGGISFKNVSLQGLVEDGALKSMSFDAGIAGGGTVSASGRWDFVSDEIDVTGTVDAVPLKTVLRTEQSASVSGTVSAEAVLSGRPADPAIGVTVRVSDPAWGRYKLSPVVVRGDRKPGADLKFLPDPVFRGIRIGPESGLIWKDGGFRGFVLDFDISGLRPQDIVPDVPTRKISGSLTAKLRLEMPSFSAGGFRGSLDSPPDGLHLEFFNRQTLVDNRDPLSVRIRPDGRVVFSGIRLDDGESTLSACGSLSDGRVDALVRGSVGAYWLRALKGVFSTARGTIDVMAREDGPTRLPEGCGPDMLDSGGAMSIVGGADDLQPDGALKTGSILLGVRRFADQIRVDSGGEIRFRRAGGESGATEVSIPEDHWITGAMGDGSFNISGSTMMTGGRLADGRIRVKAAQIRYVSAGQFYLVAEPRLDLTFDSIGMWGSARRSRTGENILISGQIDITDGSYHRNFNIVRKAFSGVTGGKVAERTSQSVLSALPWLADSRLDIGIRAPSFGVRTRLAVGQTDMDLNMNLRLKGTLEYPELWDRVEVMPGGTFTYDVVRREFEISRGIIDFDGEPGHPMLDVLARTRIEYKGGSGSLTSASRFSPDDSQDSFYGDMVQVNLTVSGRYPDLDIDVSSPTRGLSQQDLQMLLLTGMAPGESVSDASGSFVNVNLLTGSVADTLVKVLLADVVDSVSFGVTAGGDVNVDVSAHMGRRLKFQTQVLQGAGSSQYSAGFKIRLTEGLSLEGRVRAVEYSVDQSDVGRNYDTKLRYRITLE